MTSSFRKGLAVPLVALAGAAMLGWSWGTWPDALIDFGRELYIPWQLSQGQVLYRDVAHFNGPLSQYWNALLFRLFGVSLRTLVIGNLAVLAAVLALLYRLLAAVGGRGSAAIACLTFVALFAFSQYTMNGSGNFVCPYSHEITHGVLLSLAGIALMGAYQKRRKPLLAGLAGLAVGLAFLTKIEVLLAAFAATTAGLLLAVWSEPPAERKLARVAALYVGSILLPPAVAFVLLRTAMPAGQALAGTLGSWWYAFDPKLSGNEYYRRCLGVLDPERSLALLIQWSLRYGAVAVVAAAVAFYVPKPRRTRVVVAAGLLAIGACLNWLWFSREDGLRTLPDALRPLPVVVLVLGVVQMRSFLKQRTDRERVGRLVLQLAMLVFAFAMLLKMLLNVRIYHYGFALAMPAVLMMATALFDWLPAGIERRGGSGLVFSAGALGVWLALTAAHVGVSARYWGQKTCVVSRGPDAFLADWRGTAVNAAVEESERCVGPDGTLAVFPDGEMINYLARRRNPTPFIKFAPPEVIMFGEDRILAAFRAHPPDLVLLAHKDTAEYGVRFFGQDYAQGLFEWVIDHYRPLRLIGYPPLRDERFGILVLSRKRPG